jgi:hypothetical protein
MTPTKDLQERERELQLLLATPGGDALLVAPKDDRRAGVASDLLPELVARAEATCQRARADTVKWLISV